jgi:hypothetical protein
MRPDHYNQDRNHETHEHHTGKSCHRHHRHHHPRHSRTLSTANLLRLLLDAQRHSAFLQRALASALAYPITNTTTTTNPIEDNRQRDFLPSSVTHAGVGTETVPVSAPADSTSLHAHEPDADTAVAEPPPASTHTSVSASRIGTFTTASAHLFHLQQQLSDAQSTIDATQMALRAAERRREEAEADAASARREALECAVRAAREEGKREGFEVGFVWAQKMAAEDRIGRRSRRVRIQGQRQGRAGRSDSMPPADEWQRERERQRERDLDAGEVVELAATTRTSSSTDAVPTAIRTTAPAGDYFTTTRYSGPYDTSAHVPSTASRDVIFNTHIDDRNAGAPSPVIRSRFVEQMSEPHDLSADSDVPAQHDLSPPISLSARGGDPTPSSPPPIDASPAPISGLQLANTPPIQVYSLPIPTHQELEASAPSTSALILPTTAPAANQNVDVPTVTRRSSLRAAGGRIASYLVSAAKLPQRWPSTSTSRSRSTTETGLLTSAQASAPNPIRKPDIDPTQDRDRSETNTSIPRGPGLGLASRSSAPDINRNPVISIAPAPAQNAHIQSQHHTQEAPATTIKPWRSLRRTKDTDLRRGQYTEHRYADPREVSRWQQEGVIEVRSPSRCSLGCMLKLMGVVIPRLHTTITHYGTPRLLCLTHRPTASPQISP